MSDNDVWDVVQRMRKERREALRKENGLVHRLVKWAKSRSQQSGHVNPGIALVETDRSDSVGTSRSSDEESSLEHDPENTNSETNNGQEDLPTESE